MRGKSVVLVISVIYEVLRGEREASMVSMVECYGERCDFAVAVSMC